MWCKSSIVSALFMACIATTSFAAKIHIIATGGTISAKKVSANGNEYVEGKFNLKDILEAAPEVNRFGEISGEQLYNIGSQNVTPAHWFRLAKRVQEVIDNEKDLAGVVILHGTDTMAESAFLLHLLIESKGVRVVLTGAMRSGDDRSADGPANLVRAAQIASAGNLEGGCYVAMNDKVFDFRVLKTRSDNVDAFSGGNHGPIAQLQEWEVGDLNLSAVSLRTGGRFFSLMRDSHFTEFPRVEVVVAVAGSGAGPQLRDILARVDHDLPRGVVYAGYGSGTIFSEDEALLKALSAKGVIVVRSSKVERGYIYGLEIDKICKLVPSLSLNYQQASVLLRLAIAAGADFEATLKVFREFR